MERTNQGSKAGSGSVRASTISFDPSLLRSSGMPKTSSHATWPAKYVVPRFETILIVLE